MKVKNRTLTVILITAVSGFSQTSLGMFGITGTYMHSNSSFGNSTHTNQSSIDSVLPFSMSFSNPSYTPNYNYSSQTNNAPQKTKEQNEYTAKLEELSPYIQDNSFGLKNMEDDFAPSFTPDAIDDAYQAYNDYKGYSKTSETGKCEPDLISAMTPEQIAEADASWQEERTLKACISNQKCWTFSGKNTQLSPWTRPDLYEKNHPLCECHICRTLNEPRKKLF